MLIECAGLAQTRADSAGKVPTRRLWCEQTVCQCTSGQWAGTFNMEFDVYGAYSQAVERAHVVMNFLRMSLWEIIIPDFPKEVCH